MFARLSGLLPPSSHQARTRYAYAHALLPLSPSIILIAEGQQTTSVHFFLSAAFCMHSGTFAILLLKT